MVFFVIVGFVGDVKVNGENGSGDHEDGSGEEQGDSF